jgi:hypothetical protein
MADSSHADWSKLYILAGALASDPAKTKHFLELMTDDSPTPSRPGGYFEELADQIRGTLIGIAGKLSPSRGDLVQVAQSLLDKDNAFQSAFGRELLVALSAHPEAEVSSVKSTRASNATFFKRMVNG